MGTTFDTLAYAKRLKGAGVPESQAEVQADALKHLADDHLATKQDVGMLKTEMDKHGWKLNVILGLLGLFGTLITLSQYLHK